MKRAWSERATRARRLPAASTIFAAAFDHDATLDGAAT
jgi:hypothetical protein